MEKEMQEARNKLKEIISPETLILVYYRQNLGGITSHGRTIGLDFYAINPALHATEPKFHGIWISRFRSACWINACALPYMARITANLFTCKMQVYKS